MGDLGRVANQFAGQITGKDENDSPFGPIGDAFRDLIGVGKPGKKADGTELASYDITTALATDMNNQAPQALKYSDNLMAQATGAAPTSIEPLLASNNQQSLNQQLALAKSVRGVSPAVAQRNSEIAQAAIQRQNAESNNVARLQAQQQQQTAYNDYIRQTNAGIAGQYGGQVASEQANQQQRQAQQLRSDQQTGGIINSVGGALAPKGKSPGDVAPDYSGTTEGNVPSGRGIGSDRNIKTDIKQKAPGGFLDALKSYEYKYKEPSKPGQAEGEHVSVMAQDLEKAGPIGRSMVKDTPNGKMVDYSRGFAVMLAAMADINERQKKLESKKGKV